MYPLPQSPILTTSGSVPHRPSSTFKPIHPAAPSTASGPATQGSFNTPLDMVGSTQETGSSPGSSIPCAQKSPATSQPSLASTQGTSTQSNRTQVLQSQPQNVAQVQPSTANTQAVQQFQPPVPDSCATPMQQGQPQFVYPRVNPQGQPIRQQRQSSPFRQGFNPSAQPSIPAAEAQPNAVPNTPENKVPKSNGGQGVKSSAPDVNSPDI